MNAPPVFAADNHACCVLPSPQFDGITIVSSASVGRLKGILPIAELKLRSHAFEVVTYRGKCPWARSYIIVVLAGSSAPLHLLKQYEHVLRRYSVVKAEIALDMPTETGASLAQLLALVRHLGKFHHRRGHLRFVDDPDTLPPPGHLHGHPTIYLEDRQASLNLKAYARLRKEPRRRFGDPMIRLEWTINRGPALMRYLGGSRIDDLLGGNLASFVERKLRLERVSLTKVGQLFIGPKPENISQVEWDSRAWRAAQLHLRRLVQQEIAEGRLKTEDCHMAVALAETPAQLRGYLGKIVKSYATRRRGRPRLRRKRNAAITAYRVNQCFTRIKVLVLSNISVPFSN